MERHSAVPLAAWLVLASAVVAVTAAAVVARLGGGSGYAVANICAGTLAVGCAGWRMRVSGTRQAALSLIALGIGQICAGVFAGSDIVYPSVYELVAAVIAIPLMITAYLRQPTLGISDVVGYLVFGIEAMLMGLVVLYWAWHLGLERVLMTGDFPLASLMVTAYCFNIGYLLVLLMRDPALALGFAALGTALLLVAHISSIQGQLRGSLTGEPLLVGLAFGCYVAALWRPAALVQFTVDAAPSSDLRRSVLVVCAGLSVPVGIYLKHAPQVIDQVIAPGFVLSLLVLVGLATREILRAEETLRIWSRMRAQAREHALTRLGNRRALQEELERRAGREDVVLFVVDLDRFREFNGRHGQRVGDKVLLAVAMGLRDLGADVAAFCMDGNEFAVVLPGRAEVIEDMVGRIQQIVRSYTEVLAGVQHTFTATIGVATMPVTVWVPRQRGSYDGPHQEGPAGPLQALEQAEYALSVAQETANEVCVYSEDLRISAQRRAQLEQRLRQGLKSGDIGPHFQPIVEMSTGRVRGLEALARWTDDVLGIVGPGEFIPVAENSGLIGELGHVMLDRAIEMAGWLRRQGEQVYVSVNVSPIQLSDLGFADEVRTSLERHRARAADVVLEVTEGIFLDRDSLATQVLAQLAATGVRIALDDFGSGYSSLGYMSRLPIHMVKIDRSLVTQVDDDRPRAVLDGIISLCENLGLVVVVEGVETETDNLGLRAIGARYGQGWLWSSAVAPEQVRTTIDQLGLGQSSAMV